MWTSAHTVKIITTSSWTPSTVDSALKRSCHWWGSNRDQVLRSTAVAALVQEIADTAAIRLSV